MRKEINAYTEMMEASQLKCSVTFKTDHDSVEVSARNTAEAIKKASAIAKKAGKSSKSKTKFPVGDPQYDKVTKINSVTEVKIKDNQYQIRFPSGLIVAAPKGKDLAELKKVMQKTEPDAVLEPYDPSKFKLATFEISEANGKWVVYDEESGKRIPNAGKTFITYKGAVAFSNKTKGSKVADDAWYADNKSKLIKSKKENNGDNDMQIQESVVEELFKDASKVTESKSITDAYMSMFEAKDVEADAEEDDQTDVEIEKDVKKEKKENPFAKKDDSEDSADDKEDEVKEEKKENPFAKKDDDSEDDEEDVKENLTPEAAYQSILTEAKNEFKTWLVRNISITGKDKNDPDELAEITKVMKAKGWKNIKKVLDDNHVTPKEISDAQDAWIDMSL